MNQLRKTNYQGIEGWQWGTGPVFIGADAREHAVEYGRAIQCIEKLTQHASLCQEKMQARLENGEKILDIH